MKAKILVVATAVAALSIGNAQAATITSLFGDDSRTSSGDFFANTLTGLTGDADGFLNANCRIFSAK
jgi:hypothetical protein